MARLADYFVVVGYDLDNRGVFFELACPAVGKQEAGGRRGPAGALFHS